MNSKINEEAGEVISETNEQADHARSFAQFLVMLEDGQLNSELSTELKDLSKEMNDHCLNYGSKAKGKINITIDLVLDNGVFDILSKFKITKPEAPRIRSIAWTDRNNNLVSNNPKQSDMFRDVNARTIKSIS